MLRNQVVTCNGKRTVRYFWCFSGAKIPNVNAILRPKRKLIITRELTFNVIEPHPTSQNKKIKVLAIIVETP